MLITYVLILFRKVLEDEKEDYVAILIPAFNEGRINAVLDTVCTVIVANE